MRNNILLIETNPQLSIIISNELANSGYKVDLSMDGLDALIKFKDNFYDMVIVDYNTAYKSGIEVCKDIRVINKRIPILILAASGELKDKIECYTAGADDYIIKPFHWVELFARIKVFLKERPNGLDNTIIDDLSINYLTKTVKRAGTLINLTAKEFNLLWLLASNKDRVVPKLEILNKVWNESFDTGVNTIEVYISFLRKKIDKPFEKKLIHKCGFGYYIR